MIQVEHLQKDFTIHHLNKTLHAVKDISFTVEKGKFLGIVGKSGSGKSTILKSIYGTYLPQSGAIYYDSESLGRINLVTASPREIVHLRKYEIGYVSQFLSVMPRTTAYELVVQSILETGANKQMALDEAALALGHFDLDETLWNNYPNYFSGGEKLRLNIARAVVKKPRLLLLDEPTASLDNVSKLKVRQSIEKLKAQGTTLIGIFHDLEFMEGLCDDVFTMQKVLVNSNEA
ncbi:ABC transporter [Lysinibacillus sp. PLM2]|nr:ABC transporter [Lysinibacillus sp. PLM2]